MQKWVVEDLEFELTAIDGTAENCRLGIEKGDKFVFSYGCPEGIPARLFYQKMGFAEGKLTEEFGSPVQEFVLKR